MTLLQQALAAVAMLCLTGWSLLAADDRQRSCVRQAAAMRDLGHLKTAWLLERVAQGQRLIDCIAFSCAAIALACYGLTAVFA